VRSPARFRRGGGRTDASHGGRPPLIGERLGLGVEVSGERSFLGVEVSGERSFPCSLARPRARGPGALTPAGAPLSPSQQRAGVWVGLHLGSWHQAPNSAIPIGVAFAGEPAALSPRIRGLFDRKRGDRRRFGPDRLPAAGRISLDAPELTLTAGSALGPVLALSLVAAAFAGPRSRRRWQRSRR